MKKFISFVMAGAMVASLVPATAFAKGDVTATAKVVDAEDLTKEEAKVAFTKSNAPELQLKITNVDYKKSDSTDHTAYKQEIQVSLENAEFTSKPSMGIRLDDTTGVTVQPGNTEVTTDTGITPVAADSTAAVAALQAWFNASANEAALDSATAIEGGTASAGTTAAILADAETALTNAKSTAATSAATEATAVDDAEDAVTAEKNKVLTAEAQVTAAEDDLQTAKEALAAAADPTDATLLGNVNAAQTALDDAKANLVTVKAAVAAALPALESALADAKADLEAAIAGDSDVIAATTAYNTAKTKNDAAKAKYVEEYQAYNEAEDAVGPTYGSDDTILEIVCTDWDAEDPETAEFTVYGKLHKDDVLYVDLASELTKTSEGTKATVSVDSDMVTVDDLVYASVLGKGFKVSVKKLVDIAEEEVVELHSNGLKIESSVGDFSTTTDITLKLSKGFEFVKNANITVEDSKATVTREDDNELILDVTTATDELVLDGIEIEAVSAKSGATATIKATSSNFDSASCEVAKVVDYKVSLSVDEDEDVPVIYSGVDAENEGITDDSEHLSLEVTAEETFPGAWSMRKGFNFNLPEGVYVTDVKLVEHDGLEINEKAATTAQVEQAFKDAYQDGDHKNFEFDKRVFDDVDVKLNSDEAKMVFELELVADPTFEGDVVLTLEGDLVDKQEVTIAKFVKPYTVKAEQNDLIIDYRNTEIPSAIVFTEAEEGLWEEGATFTFSFDKDDVMEFEDDATFEIDKDSELEIDDTTKNGTLTIEIDEESEAAATVTIKDMKLFMSRNIPAGAYDLEISSSLAKAYEEQGLFAPDQNVTFTSDARDKDKESFVDDVCDYSETVKEAFVNVVTSGRDQDNLFTTKVVVPVGESYMVAGEEKVELDVAAYISEAGYTMLPVRAVSKALGVNTNNVLWNAEARTVTIMYGQRIITMTVGQKVIYVNGSAVPSSAAPEIKDGRTFLPLRDLGTALGVTDVSWDGATKTATMNGAD